MKQRSLFNLYLALTTGILSGARRVAMTLLATILLSMTAQPAWAETVDGVKYIDANGVEQTRDGVIVLTDSEKTLGETGGTESSPTETWYLCDTNRSYSTLSSYNYCNVNIILADGVVMSVENSSSSAIYIRGSLGIYGQSTGTNRGALTAKGTSSGIYANNDVTICSAKVTANGTTYGIISNGYDNGDVTIIGSEVTATANGTSGNAIFTYGGNITIKEGAEVTAEGNLAIYTPGGGISITRGKVTANGIECGIETSGSDKNITIEKAEVTATANGSSGYAIHTAKGRISITGGKVTANGTEYGIEASGLSKDITIKDAEVKAEGNYAIYAPGGGVSITGGKVTANGIECGIETSGSDKNITIEKAEVTATATGTSGNAIYAFSGGVSITGSKVTANGTSYGINGKNGVDLKWTNATDFIFASSYEVGDGKVVKTADGQRFVAFTVDNTNPESPVENGSAIIAGTVSDLATIAGKMLRPLDGYCVDVPEGLHIIGKTPDFVIGSVSYYQIAAGESVTVEASRQGVEFTGANMPAGTTFNADYTQATFTMPAGVDVAITGVRYWGTEVAYIDAAGNQATTPAGTKVYVLTGSETTLGEDGGTEKSPTETWYLCDTNRSYTSTLSSYNYCNVNIILADGVEMSVESSSSNAIYIQGSLGIYGQSTGNIRGALTAKGTSRGIYAQNDVTICSAEVTATGDDAIYTSNGGVSITGGKVTANGKFYGIHADASGKDITVKDAEVTATANGSSGYAIYSYNGGVSITGGKVTAEGTTYGINAGGSDKDVTISGAEVEATGTSGYAICSSNGGVSITGGKVTANGSYCGIRAYGSGKDVTISGAEVTVTVTGNSGYAICSDRGDVTIKDAEVTATANGSSGYAIYSSNGGVSITGGKVTANGKYYGIGAYGSNKDVTIKEAEVTAEGNYAIYATGGGVSITGGKVTANGTSYGIEAGGSNKDVTIKDAEVTAEGNYAIYAPVGGVSITGGKVTANGTEYGIEASGYEKDITIKDAEVKAEGNSAISTPTTGGGISITGGKVTATGTKYGICTSGSGKDITIEDAEVTATATGTSGFAIYSEHGGVSITGGKVTAEGTTYGIAALGSDKNITIKDAEVTAEGNYAIYTPEGDVSITGGKVTANGTSWGILAYNDVTISNAEVTATATGTSGKAITSLDGGSISISDGSVVTAKGTSYGVYGALTINGGTVGITGGSALSDINSYVANGGKVTLTSTSGNVYKVTFDDEWSDIPEVSLYSGSTVAEPTAPVRNGYVLGGWKNGSTLYDFNMPVTSDLALVSVWKKLLTNDDIKVDAIEDQAYTGSALTPAVTVKDGETDITDQCDITYSDNTNVGTATVTITAKASSTAYTGETTTTFIIVRPMENLFADGCSWTGYVAEEDLLLPDFLTAYIITALGEGTVTATPLEYVPKGEPVLLKREDNTKNSYAGIAGMGTAPTGNLLKVASASSQPTAFRDYGLYQDAFVLIGGGTLATGKVYLPVPQSQSRIATCTIVIEGETTSLRNVNVEIAESEEWFDLQGRKLDGKPAKKGVYIHNGKKEVVR